VSITVYNLFLFLYRLGMQVIAPWNPKAKQWLAGRKDFFEKLRFSIGKTSSPVIWMHCASLGEFEQGRPLLETVRMNYPDYRILLTFFSPSGYEVKKNYEGADYIFYMPMDNRYNAAKMLEIVNPAIVLWIKYEYWYYYLTAIRERNIPLLLVSGIFRPDQPFFKSYGSLHRKMLASFTHFFVQTNDSKNLLNSVGISQQVTVSGDTRFDRVVQIADNFSSLPVIENFCGNDPVIVAGSTWPDDEEELDHYANTHPHIKFIIAPHEIYEEHLKEIEKLFHASIRYSQLANKNPQNISDPQTPNVLIIDNIGMLSRLYKYATIAYIGGGFGDDGVHNVLEAAVYAKPVVFGPEYDKYVEAIELVENGAAFPVEQALELEQTMNRLLNNKCDYDKACKAAGNYVHENKGATKKIMNYIQANRLLTN